jgi:hypothetical protein
VKFSSIFVLFVEFVEDMHQDCRIFSSTGSDGDPISGFEKVVLNNGLMDFSLEPIEEAVLADGLLSLGSFDHGLVDLANLT